jgi:hypothetical protein
MKSFFRINSPAMIKRLPFYILVLLCALASSCKKTAESFSGAKVLTATNMVAGYIDTYTYNSDGSVALIQRNSGEKVAFIYAGDSVSRRSINAASVVESITNYFLRGDTYADTSYGLVQAQNNSSTYAFNSDGQLVQQKNFAFGNPVLIADYSLTNKNVSSIAYTNPASNTHSYAYYSFGTATNSIGNQNFGQGFLGVGNLNVVNTCVQIAQNGDTTGIITYKYRYNGGSDIDTMVSYNRNGLLLDSMAYSYK